MNLHEEHNDIIRAGLLGFAILLLVVSCTVKASEHIPVVEGVPNTFAAGFVLAKSESMGFFIVVEGYTFPTISSCYTWMQGVVHNPEIRYECHQAGLLSASQ